MIQNKKIIQVVICNQNEKFLQYRLEEFNIVDFLLIITTDNQQIINQNLKILESSSSKFKIKNLNSSNFYSNLRDEILNLSLDFEDIIILSNDNEFVNFKNFSSVLENLKFDFQIIKHIPFWWSPKFYSEPQSFGSLIFSFSQFLIYPNFFKIVKNKRNNLSNFSDNHITNGWSVNHFYNRPNNSEFFITNQLPYNSVEQKLKIFNYDFNIPDFFSKLDYDFFEIEKREFYFEINDSDSIEIPKKQWYECENYNLAFKINEYYNLIVNKFPNEFDIIKIKYKNKIYEFEFKELKFKFLSEIINPS